MAEFTDLGSHCALQDCNSLDFLPFVCSYCRSTFCTKHSSPTTHDCPNFEKSTIPPIECCSISTYQCSKADCNRKELVQICCEFCALNFCLKHRFKSDHDCSCLSPKSSTTDGKLCKNDIDIEKFANQRQKFEEIKKKDAITTKVALMKLKQTALSDNCSIPEEERLYFYVDLPKTAKFPVLAVCFSKEWSIGKCIDVIVKLAEIPLANPKNDRQRLRLFSKIDQEYRFLSPDDSLNHLIISNLISNATNLYAFYF